MFNYALAFLENEARRGNSLAGTLAMKEIVGGLPPEMDELMKRANEVVRNGFITPAERADGAHESEDGIKLILDID